MLAAPDHELGLSAAAVQHAMALFSANWGTGRGTFHITSDAPDVEAAVEAPGAL
jgi:hypothetical protein